MILMTSANPSSHRPTLEEMHEAHARGLSGWVRKHFWAGDTSDHEDICQEVWEQARASLHTFDPSKGSEKQWLIRIAKGRLARRGGALKRQPKEESYSEEEHPTSSSSDTESQLNAARLLEKLLSGLTEQQRSVLILHGYKEQTYSEIARALNIPVGTVSTDLAAVRAHALAIRSRMLAAGQASESDFRGLPIPIFALGGAAHALFSDAVSPQNAGSLIGPPAVDPSGGSAAADGVAADGGGVLRSAVSFFRALLGAKPITLSAAEAVSGAVMLIASGGAVGATVHAAVARPESKPVVVIAADPPPREDAADLPGAAPEPPKPAEEAESSPSPSASAVTPVAPTSRVARPSSSSTGSAPIDPTLERMRASVDSRPDKTVSLGEKQAREAPDANPEERDRLMIEAMINQGRVDEARAQAAAFRSKYPKSIYQPALDAMLSRAKKAP